MEHEMATGSIPLGSNDFLHGSHLLGGFARQRRRGGQSLESPPKTTEKTHGENEEKPDGIFRGKIIEEIRIFIWKTFQKNLAEFFGRRKR